MRVGGLKAAKDFCAFGLIHFTQAYSLNNEGPSRSPKMKTRIVVLVKVVVKLLPLQGYCSGFFNCFFKATLAFCRWVFKSGECVPALRCLTSTTSGLRGARVLNFVMPPGVQG
jgi:hypothetical protein